MPCLMCKLAVGAYAIDLRTEFLEFIIIVGHIDQFRRTHKCEVCRIEEENGPFALEIGIGHFLKFPSTKASTENWGIS